MRPPRPVTADVRQTSGRSTRMEQSAAIHRGVCGAFVRLGFLARAGHAAPQRPGLGDVDAFAGAQLWEANMSTAAIIQSLSGERDEADIQRHGFATMKSF
jgi:hypothetical protein